MKAKLLCSLLLGLVLLASAASSARADGIIIPPRPCEGHGCPTPPVRPIAQLDIRYHHVSVRIDDQLAVTRVDQVFHNPNDYPIEGTYIFPLPLDAVVNNFTLWVDGKPVEGKVLSAEQARQTYEDSVRQLKDPALLEYIGRGAVQASVFPIPPGGEQRITLEYNQALTASNGLVHYVYPLNTEKFSAHPLESVTVKVEVSSTQPIRAVYSSSHPIEINRPDDTHATASYEASDLTPDADFSLYYSTGSTQAFHLFTYRDPANPTDPDGFFLLMLAPRPGEVQQVIAKDVLLVLDHSGSMDGEKFQQAQAALRFILQHLNPSDRFHLTAFSSDIEMYADQLRPASEAQQALAWVNGLSSSGSTDINRALLEAAAVVDPERPTYLIFLTDGLPTEGVTDSDAILQNLAAAARPNLRLFAFGVGYDVDTFLLDSLSQENHGLSTYVKPGESLDEVLSSFYARISTPVLTSLKLDFGQISVYDVYPNPLPDLFTGSQMIVTGRYKESGAVDAVLTGQVNGETQTFRYPLQSFVADSRILPDAPNGLPRLWATRKIGALLNQLRLKGPNQELVDQVVQLSIRYGIVTPYTSYLVTEPMPLGLEEQQRVAQDAFNQMQTAPAAPSSGRVAVQKAAGQGALSQADVAATVPSEDSQRVRAVGDRTFVLKEGVWLDTTYDPDKMKPIQVAFLSPDYFSLAASNPVAAAALALGPQVIAVIDGQAYQVMSETSKAPPLKLTVIPLVSATPAAAAVLTSTPVELSATLTRASPQPPSAAATAQPTAAQPGGFKLTAGLVIFPCLGGLLAVLIVFWAFKKK